MTAGSQVACNLNDSGDSARLGIQPMTNAHKTCLLLCVLFCANRVNALEIAPGDYEPIPPGMTALLTYFQHAERSDLYQNGKKVSDDFNLRSDVALLRVIHSVGLGENLVVQPQFILPYGRLHTSGDAAALGDTTGTGDLILGAPFIWTLSNAGKDIFSLAPFLYLPTGSYDNEDALNVGENRWRFLLQAVYTHHFSEKWALDTAADVSWVSDNDDYGPYGETLEQKARYEYQGHLRYNWTPKTTLAVGAGHIDGARSSVDGIGQHDATRTTYARLTVTHFIEPTLQIQAQIGQDLDVEQGPKEKARLNLRFAKLF